MSELGKKYNCNIIRDLLPLYHDGVCSEQSKAIVEEHLEECTDCKSLASRLENTRIDDVLTEERESILGTHARREKKTAMQIGIITAGILMIPVIVCLICNLAIGHGLDWFFIVLASLLIVASFTVVPLVAAERKLYYAILAGTASLVLLLLTCCIYSRGDWFFLVTIPTLFGLSVVLMPYMVYQVPFEKFPEPLQAVSRHKGLIVMIWDTLWLYATIVICGIHSSDPDYWRIALPVTTLCVLILWICFLIIRYMKISAIAKAGGVCILLGLFTLFGNDICTYFIDGRWDMRISHMDFVTWSWKEPMSEAAIQAYNANVNGLTGLVLLAAGIIIFLIGVRRKKQ